MWAVGKPANYTIYCLASSTILPRQYHTVSTVPYCLGSTILSRQYHTASAVPYCFDSTILSRQYHTASQYHTVSTVPYCLGSTILSRQYPYCLGSTGGQVRFFYMFDGIHTGGNIAGGHECAKMWGAHPVSPKCINTLVLNPVRIIKWHIIIIPMYTLLHVHYNYTVS